MTAAVKMYEIYPSFFSSTNEPKPNAETYKLDTFDSSLTIAKFAKEIIFNIAINLPINSFVLLRSTSHRFQRTLSAMPGMNQMATQLAKEYKVRLEEALRRAEALERVQKAAESYSWESSERTSNRFFDHHF